MDRKIQISDAEGIETGIERPGVEVVAQRSQCGFGEWFHVHEYTGVNQEPLLDTSTHITE